LATLGAQDPTVTLQNLCSIIDKEIVHGQDDEEEKDFKSKETNNLCLFNLWEGHEDPFPPLFAC